MIPDHRSPTKWLYNGFEPAPQGFCECSKRTQIELPTTHTVYAPIHIASHRVYFLRISSLYLNANSQPEFKYRNFEKGEVLLTANEAVTGNSTVELVFDYDGVGWARGGEFSLIVNGKTVAQDRIGLTPPAYFSIDETFDVGIDTGSPAGDYPANKQGFPFAGGELQTVTISIR